MHAKEDDFSSAGEQGRHAKRTKIVPAVRVGAKGRRWSSSAAMERVRVNQQGMSKGFTYSLVCTDQSINGMYPNRTTVLRLRRGSVRVLQLIRLFILCANACYEQME